MMPLKDLTGKRFGCLTVIRRALKDSACGQPLWLCRCACGSHRTLFGYVLRSGRQTSCGCRNFISPARRHLKWIEEKQATGWTYAQMLAAKPGLAKGVKALREAVLKARKRQIKQPRLNLSAETVKTLFAVEEAAKAGEVASKLGISERQVVRLKKAETEPFRADYEIARRMRLWDGEDWDDINSYLGKPYPTAAQLELAWNLEADRRAGLLDFSDL